LKKNHKGFTLIELIIVLSIFSVLITMAMPQYLKLVFRAQEKKALFNLESIYNGQKMFWFETASEDPDNGNHYVHPGNEDLLESYIDYTQSDKHWDYYLVNTADNDILFVAEAAHKNSNGALDGKTISIDQDHVITKSY